MRKLLPLVLFGVLATASQALAGPLFSWPGPVTTRTVLADNPAFFLNDFEISLNVTVAREVSQHEFSQGLFTKYKGNVPTQSDWGIWAAHNSYDGTAMFWMVCGNGYQCVATAPGSVQVNVPYSLRAVYQGTSVQLWVDGALAASGTITRNSWWSNTPAVIAGSVRGDSESPFFGTISNVEINGVPDTGSCVFLLAISLAGLSTVRRHLR